MPPNVLLIVLDAARRDAVEPYGAPSARTPAIADLARRGYALPSAYANSSWTLPSHASMFTGLLPRALGLTQPPDGSAHSARAALERCAERMLPAVLRDAGYETHGFSTNLWASGHAGFDLGFDSFRYFTGGREERLNELLRGDLRGKLAWAREGLRSSADDGARAVGTALRDAIESWSGTPAFWFVNLVECHSPYLPPRPWNDLGAANRARAALEAQRHLNFLSICLFVAGHHHVPVQALERMRHLYRRAVSYMDDWLAGVLDVLDRRRILDETLVIVTSDHGENFGENGLIVHGFSLDERLIRVPFVSAGPGTVRTDTPFTLAELPRAIAAAAEISAHPWDTDELPDGIAVAQYDAMGPARDPRVREFAEKWRVDEAGIERLTASFTAATDGLHKAVLRNEELLFYDLQRDPGELSPISAGRTNGPYEALRAALEHSAVTADRQVAAPNLPAVVASDAELAALERQMKLLGYL